MTLRFKSQLKSSVFKIFGLLSFKNKRPSTYTTVVLDCCCFFNRRKALSHFGTAQLVESQLVKTKSGLSFKKFNSLLLTQNKLFFSKSFSVECLFTSFA